MAKYSYDKYGNFIYGVTNPDTSPYYQSKITAESVDYKSIEIKWEPINPDPLIGVPTYWALVKTFNGKPDDPYDGRVITADSMDRYVTSWIENYVTTFDREVNYSVWVFTDGHGWTFCGNANALIIGETTTSDLISKWIPRAWQNDKQLIGDSVGEYELQDLMTAITAYSVEYDKLRVMSKMLEKVNTSKYITNNYAATKLLDFGFSYEPNLGDPYYRTLAITGEKINSLKGTIQGLSEYITALTHLQNKIEIGHNLFLDYNDSSFEESMGNWACTSELAVQTTYTVEGISAPSPNVYDIEAMPRSVGLFKVPAHTTEMLNGFQLSLPKPQVSINSFFSTSSSDGTTKYMIPVVPSTRYIFSGWAKSVSSYQINVTITWYDYSGTQISETADSYTTLAAGAWTEFKSASDAYRNGKLSPSNAAFASIMVAGTATNPKIYFDMFQFCEWQNSLSYEDARLIKIYLRGQDENLLRNPSFTEGIGGWFGSLVSSTYLDSENGYLGITTGVAYSAEESLTKYPGGLLWSDWMEVDPGISYTFSVEDVTDLEAVIGIEFSNPSTEEDQTSVKELGDVYYYDNFTYKKKEKISLITYDPLTGTLDLLMESTTSFVSGDLISIIGTESSTYDGDYTISLIDGPFNAPATISILGLTLEVEEYEEEEYTVAYLVSQERVYANTTEDVLVVGHMAGLNYIPEVSSVTAIAPAATKDSGKPYARVYIKPINAGFAPLKRARFAPTLIEDRTVTYSSGGGTGGTSGLSGMAGGGDIVSLNPSYSTIYFDGNGNTAGDVTTGFDPIQTQFFNPNNCFWETSIRYNFVSNSNFETNITGWTAYDAFSSVSNDTTTGYIGTKSLKITSSDISYATRAQYTVSLPHPAVGGESVSLSAYVKGAPGVYTIGAVNATNYGLYDVSSTQTIALAQSTEWTRISSVVILSPNQTSITLFISSYIDDGYTSYNVDAVQAEWGQTPSHFIKLSDPGTFALSNPYTPADTLWAAYNQNINNGKSSYISEWGVKFNRLFATLNNFVPTGSTWTLKTGWPTNPVQDLSYSLIPSASFENDLGDWSAEAATVERVPYIGSQLDHITHGIAYGRVKSTRTSLSTDYAFGITSDKIYVNPNKGYYGSVAVRPTNVSALSPAIGSYSIKIDGYNAADELIQTFDNTLIFKEDYILPGTNFTVNTSAPVAPELGDRWLNPDTGRMYTYVDDINSNQWAEVDEYNYYTNSYTPDTRYTYSSLPPATPAVGDRWIDTDTQIGYTWFNDGDTTQWVEFAVIYTDSSSYLDLTYSPRWAYLNIVLPKGSLVLPNYGAAPETTVPVLQTVSYVKFRVECEPDAWAANQAFDVDRAIFRE